jgi:hypothetical protein
MSDLGDGDDLYADFGSPVGERGGDKSVSDLPEPCKQALQEAAVLVATIGTELKCLRCCCMQAPWAAAEAPGGAGGSGGAVGHALAPLSC